MVLAILAMMAAGRPGYGGEAVRDCRVFEPGEELRYAVRWKFVRLGTMVVRTVRDSSCRTPEETRVTMAVASNPDISIIAIREWNESIINTVSLSSVRFRGKHTNGDETVLISQTYDPASRLMTHVVTDASTLRQVRADTLRDCEPYVEGPALLFHTRAIARSLGIFDVPTCVNGKVGNTRLRFGGKIEEITIGAVRRPVRTRAFDGCAEWTGGSSAGVSGAFAGWMSDDDAAVPIKAELKILVGSITLELESWIRPGWTPPTGLTAENR
jgi:hypothetical protein